MQNKVAYLQRSNSNKQLNSVYFPKGNWQDVGNSLPM